MRRFCYLLLSAALLFAGCNKDKDEDNNNNTTPADTVVVKPTDTHETIDLGLSVKWASMNIGATKPTEYGKYFAWGETEEKEVYTMETCATWGKDSTALVAEGIADANGNLTEKYDPATVHWGKEWRTPTREEIKELVENCEFEIKKDYEGSGINGLLATSKKNGKTMFMPFGASKMDEKDKLVPTPGVMNEDGSYLGATWLRPGDVPRQIDFENRFYGLGLHPGLEQTMGTKTPIGQHPRMAGCNVRAVRK